MEVEFTEKALEDITYWKKSGNIKAQRRISQLIESIKESPFAGIGKPHALKENLSGYWSRRITKEHRLVYSVDQEKEVIAIIQCRFHY